PFEILFVGGPGAFGDAGAARDGDQVGTRRARRRLAAGNLIDAVVPDHDGQVGRRPHGDGRQTAELHQQRAVAFQRYHVPLRLRDGDAERDRDRQSHAAEHIEILRPLAARPQIEIGVADAADHRFLVLELCGQTLGQFKAVHDLGVMRAPGALRIVLERRHDANTLPPVKSGDRMKATGACVATACLIERSMMKASSSWRVTVWCSTPSESSTGRMVLHTMAWPRLNSPSVPRSDTKMSAGICDGTTSEASAFGMVPKPEVCISTAPRSPPIKAPVTMPTASSSRVQTKVVKWASSCSALISGVNTRSGT